METLFLFRLNSFNKLLSNLKRMFCGWIFIIFNDKLNPKQASEKCDSFCDSYYLCGELFCLHVNGKVVPWRLRMSCILQTLLSQPSAVWLFFTSFLIFHVLLCIEKLFQPKRKEFWVSNGISVSRSGHNWSMTSCFKNCLHEIHRVA